MLPSLEKNVLKRYPKAICHLNYSLKQSRKLGFILGAGISCDLKIPTWKQLLDAMETRVSYDGQSPGPETYRGEQLFQYFRKDKSRELEWAAKGVAEAGVNSDWRRIVSSILYKEYLKGDQVDLEKFTEAVNTHPYLREIAKIAGDLELVITHNFDNALEVAVDTEPTNNRPENRKCNSFWKPDPFLRQNMLNVYHPNGFSPTIGLKGSDSIILTEANFADYLADTNTVESNFLLSHMSNKTWLLIGHSLADGTLKNALRIHANRRPGHVNYFVHWVKEAEDELTAKQRGAIREANFSTYNLVTFFLNSSEIAALLRLINMSEGDLHEAMSAEDIRSRYTYYVCGAVSSGKSTILSHLRSMATVEEWPDKMPLAMTKPSIDLDLSAKADIDTKLEEAIWRKNEEIGKIKVGLVAVDRAPLDFIAFPDNETESSTDTARNRHDKVLRRIQRQQFKELCEGQIIVVQAVANVLLERQIQRGRLTSDTELQSSKALTYLEKQQNLMLEIYDAAITGKSTVRGDCCSVAACIQDVVRIIYFQDFKPFDFNGRLETYLSGERRCGG